MATIIFILPVFLFWCVFFGAGHTREGCNKSWMVIRLSQFLCVSSAPPPLLSPFPPQVQCISLDDYRVFPRFSRIPPEQVSPVSIHRYCLLSPSSAQCQVIDKGPTSSTLECVRLRTFLPNSDAQTWRHQTLTLLPIISGKSLGHNVI